MTFKLMLPFISLYFSSVSYLYTDIHLKVSMTSSLFKYMPLPSYSKELAYIHPLNKVLVADYDTHIYYFFSAPMNKLSYFALEIVEPPLLQQMSFSEITQCDQQVGKESTE